MSEPSRSPSGPASPRRAAAAPPRLGPARKTVYALGDVTINTALTSMSLVYTSYFLVQVADVRPLLAGLVPLIGRVVDAVTDPLMGEISDRTPWRVGRRRPWFLIGAVPFGLSFAALWVDLPADSEGARFAYYTAMYCLLSMAMTVVSVPYLAIQPEMALDYDERTSLNTYRTVGSMTGLAVAVNVREVAQLVGGGEPDFAGAGVLLGIFVTLPWIAVFLATFERRRLHDGTTATFLAGLRSVFAHRTFSRLTAIYIMGRISMDLAGALIILYTTFWLGRIEDFNLVMMCFLGSTTLALPLWLHLARGRDKARVFVLGSLWWMTWSVALAFVQPEWPRWVVFVGVAVVGVGYAVVDLMPWSMVGEVVDEDELEGGLRREGIYNGVFTFLRKLGGALGVAMVMGVLDLAGYEKGEQQTETARQAIRWSTALAPAFFLGIGVWLARGYPLTRERHDAIRRELARRRGEDGP
jgi:sugar (glycoside-pentoside-hexuronide) transporter